MLQYKSKSSGICMGCHTSLTKRSYICIHCSNPDRHEIMSLCINCEKFKYRFHPSEHTFALTDPRGRFHIKTWFNRIKKNSVLML